jgi:hypothetical protein
MARRRTPPPLHPWCLIAKTQFGLLRVLKVPEMYVVLNRLTDHGWMVLVRDSEMSLNDPAPVMDMKLLSNPRRRVDADRWREEGA